MHVLQIAGLILLALFLVICVLAGFGHLTRGTPISRVRPLGSAERPAVSTKAFIELIQRAADGRSVRVRTRPMQQSPPTPRCGPAESAPASP